MSCFGVKSLSLYTVVNKHWNDSYHFWKFKNIRQGRGFPTLNMRYWFCNNKGQGKGGFLEEINSPTTLLQITMPSKFNLFSWVSTFYLYATWHVNILFYCCELTTLNCRLDSKRLLLIEKCEHFLFAVDLRFTFHVCASVLHETIFF